MQEPGEVSWPDEAEDSDKIKALRIESAAKSIFPQLMSHEALRLVSLYAYKGRVKPAAQLVEKKIRKVIERRVAGDTRPYEIEHITDVVGVRLVSLFRKDLAETVSHVLSWIREGDIFVPDGIREAIIYTVNERDHITKTIQRGFNDHLITAKVVSKQAYSSIHIIACMKCQVSGDKISEGYYVPIEIQIRTVFEDAWGEIDHKFGYVMKTGKEVGVTRNPDSVFAHLDVLKQFADACAAYADRIANEAVPDSDSSLSAASDIVPVDEDLTKRLRELGVQDSDLSKFAVAGEIQTAAREEFPGNPKKAAKSFLDAADAYRQILEDSFLEPPSETQHSDYMLYYYLRMNESICLLSTHLERYIKQALDLYKELEDLYDGFPLLQLRIGQAYGRLNLGDKAIKHLLCARELAEKIRHSEDETDQMTNSDYKHVRTLTPFVLGFEYWKKSRAKDVDEECDLITKALEETLQTPRDEPTIVNHEYLANNLVYFSAHMIKNYGSDRVVAKTEINTILNDNLTILQEWEAASDAGDDLDILDTLLLAYQTLGDKPLVKDMAQKILDLGLSDKDVHPVNPQDRLDIMRCAKAAYATAQA